MYQIVYITLNKMFSLIYTLYTRIPMSIYLDKGPVPAIHRGVSQENSKNDPTENATYDLFHSFSWTFGRRSGCSPKKKNTTKWKYMGVSKNRGTPKSSNLIGFSIINHPFWGTTIFGNTHIFLSCATIPRSAALLLWLVSDKMESNQFLRPVQQVRGKDLKEKRELGEMTAKHSRH